jgi:AraC-like DNA-binding protein
MDFKAITPDKSISLFVKNILLFEEEDNQQKTILPFFADGYPGLIFHETPNGLYVNPHKKRMPPLFVYGQTIKPIEIEIYGTYQMVVFQLFPFTLKSLFSVDPKSINDYCYDLSLDNTKTQHHILSELSLQKNLSSRISLLTSYISELVDAKRNNLNNAIYLAITKIILAKGRCKLTDMADELYLTKRTFERKFLAETGLLPKQFAKIIQFQNSLLQLSVKDFTFLTDVVYENGFADQSHFIRVFKSYTGKTPKQFVGKQNDF